MPLLTDALRYAGNRTDYADREIIEASAISKIVFSISFLLSQAPRFCYNHFVTEKSYTLLKNATPRFPSFNLSPRVAINAHRHANSINFWTKDSILAALGDLLCPKGLVVHDADEIGDDFVLELVQRFRTLEFVCLVRCENISPRGHLQLLAAPSEVLRITSAAILVADKQTEEEVISFHEAGLVSCVLRNMIDVRGSRHEVNLLTAGLGLLDVPFAKQFVKPTVQETAAVCERLLWLLDHDSTDVLINSTCLLSSLCSGFCCTEKIASDCCEAFLNSNVAFVALAYLENIADSVAARMATEEIKSVHNVCTCISLAVSYLLDRSRLSEFMVYLNERHRLLEILTKLLMHHMTSPLLQQEAATNVDYSDAIAAIFLVLDAVSRAPPATDRVLSMMPLAIDVCVSELNKERRVIAAKRDDDDDDDDNNRERNDNSDDVDDVDDDDDDEVSESSNLHKSGGPLDVRCPVPSHLAVCAILSVFSLPTMLPFDLWADEEDDAHNNDLFQGMAPRRDDAEAMMTRLSLFVRICDMMQDKETTRRMIFGRFLEGAVALGDQDLSGWDDSVTEYLTAMRAVFRALLLLRYVARSVTAEAHLLILEIRRNDNNNSNNNGAGSTERADSPPAR